jgi:hypothetical protein
VIELYAITDEFGPELPNVAPLRAVATGRLAAVVAPATGAEVSAEALWRHEEVVEALMRDRDLLPVRYGTRFDDEQAVAEAVDSRRGELSAALERVRGAVELALRVHTTELATDSVSRDVSGAEYLRAKARDAAMHEHAVRRVHEPLSGLARASVQRPGRTPPELLRAAYLVDRDGLEHFAPRIARLQETQPQLRLLCTGPWPPYSFAEP